MRRLTRLYIFIQVPQTEIAQARLLRRMCHVIHLYKILIFRRFLTIILPQTFNWKKLPDALESDKNRLEVLRVRAGRYLNIIPTYYEKEARKPKCG